MTTSNSTLVKKPVPPVQQAEINRFAEMIQALDSGKLDTEDFRKFRLNNGIYGIRGTTVEHMIRIKLKWGNFSADQLDAIAKMVNDFAEPKSAHVTTRQAIQMHHIKRSNIPALLQQVADCGLTSREGCGNTVRNVTASHFAGIDPLEVFDVRPYAQAVADYFLRNPISQNLPRKFKIAFEGSPIDHARICINDFGAVAKIKNINGKDVRGFQCYVGGGLGATPNSAVLIEEFTPEDLLIPTIEACIHIHDRYGNRKDKAKARIKFVLKEWGLDRMRQAIQDERNTIVLTKPGLMSDYHIKTEGWDEQPPTVDIPATVPVPTDRSYQRWKATNVSKQKQAGHYTVLVRCLLGDITIPQMHDLAALSRKYCGGRLRTSITQNIVMQWVPEKALPLVYADLIKAGLAEPNADRIADITRCPGADTCQIAITHSKGLASAITPLFKSGDAFTEADEIQDIKIKISGCFNSCGQHHIADIGFYGSSINVDGQDVPHYVMLLGGYTQEGIAKFGRMVTKVPARRAPEAVKTLLDYYRKNRESNEIFRAFVDRITIPKIKEILLPFTTIDPNDPKKFEDLGAEGVAYKMEMGKGECAA